MKFILESYGVKKHLMQDAIHQNNVEIFKLYTNMNTCIPRKYKVDLTSMGEKCNKHECSHHHQSKGTDELALYWMGGLILCYIIFNTIARPSTASNLLPK
jgi:hypothetical protein